MRYQRFLRKSTYRRYGIFVATIFFSYYSIQAYINNQTIDTSIDTVRYDIDEINQEIAYLNNFYQQYLQTEYAPYFLGHENGQLYQGERIVRLKYRPSAVIEAERPTRDQEAIILKTPQEGRKYFIETRLEELEELGIM